MDENRIVQSNVQVFMRGVRDGIPVALGYLAVAFSLGIAARNAGLGPFQGFITSMLNMASAGEYAGFTSMAADATYIELAAVTFIANARYLLMSASLSQKVGPQTPAVHRYLMGFAVTDELFGLSIAQKGWLNPFYLYGAYMISMPAWSSGTAIGIIVGNLLPLRAVSALSVALYGMFLAVIIPPARKSRRILILVALSFALSALCTVLPGISTLSSGSRTILLTLLIAGGAAVFFPVREEEEAK